MPRLVLLVLVLSLLFLVNPFLPAILLFVAILVTQWKDGRNRNTDHGETSNGSDS